MIAVGTVDTNVFKKVESRILGNIPESWIKTTLGECFKWGSGGTPKSGNSEYYGGNIPWLVIGDLNDSIINESSQKITEKGLHNSSAKLVDEGTLLLAMYGSIGKLGIAGMKLATNQAIAFAEKNEIETKYLFNFLLYVRLQLNTLGKGATQQNISQTVIKAFPFPLAPLNEQKRIVAKIEELFSELDNGIASLKTAREQLKVYRQAVLKHAFEGKLTAKWREKNADKLESPEQLLAHIQQEREARYQEQLEDWETNIKDGKKLSKLIKPTKIVQVKHEDLPILPIGWAWIEYSGICEKIRNGIAVKPSGEYGDKIFRISAVRAMEFNLDDIRYLQHPDGQYNDYFLSKGDLVFTRYNGTRDYVGVCAEYKGDGTHLYPDKLIQTRVAVTSIIPSYLEKAINSGGSRKFMEKRIRTTAGQSGISGSDVKQMPVPICCKGEQAIIVLHLDRLLSIIKAINEEIESALTKAATLRQSILKKAFSGQLVPQDPTDEPASELLARIQAEKEFVNTLKTKKTNKKQSVSGH